MPQLSRWFSAALAAFVLAAGAPACWAQHRAALLKQHRFIQTGAAGVAEDGVGQPWRFQVIVDGSVSGLAFASPGGAWQAVSLSPSSGNYEFAQDFPVAGAVDSIFPDGRFALAFDGRTLPLRLEGGAYPEPPRAEVSAGRWREGVLVIDPARPETITLQFDGGYLPGRAYLSIAIEPRTGGRGYSDRVSSAGGGAIDLNLRQNSLTIPADALTDGASYTVELVLYRCTSVDQSTVPGLAVMAAYSTATTFLIRAQAGSAPAVEAQATSFRAVADIYAPPNPLRLR